MRTSLKFYFLVFLVSVFTGSALAQQTAEATGFEVDFETFTLDNGLKVIFHVDRSDPVVAVALTSHVGSAREKEGRTGFAHLFEHLLFLESENLGKGGLDKLSARIGGSGANGSTSRDRTNYFQTVPNDALEKMIWAEADKLGYFINTVTEPVLAKEKQVVKNEKRQAVDNRPYGHTQYVIDKNLYPEGHPYSWQVIGSLEDLQNATLADVKEFFNRWYVPNNVVLTIAGDFNTDQAKEWVEKYFGEIERGPEVKDLDKRPAGLEQTKKLYFEDNFARLPELTMAWPSVPSYDKDSYALDVLANYLAEGKNAPFYKELVADKKLTPNVRMYNYNSELAGQFMLQVRAYDGTDLDKVQSAIEETFKKFEKEGISEKDLKRIKAGQETSFYNSLSSVLGKGFQLAQYEIFANDPDMINKEIEYILAVTPQDVMRVYKKYIQNKPFVATSFVPKGQVELALEGSKPAEVEEEEIVMGAEQEFDLEEEVTYQRTPSSFDRTVEPPYGDSPQVKVPEIWEDKLEKGLAIYGITNSEVPLVQFMLEIKGGMLLEDPSKIGVSNLLANLLTKGTKNRTPQELEEAIELLGANIRVDATDEKMIISGSTLAKNFDETMDLVREILLEPRWDEEEFSLVKQQVISRIQQEKASPNNIASDEFKKLIFGKDHILSHNNLGTEESVAQISLEDLKNYYNKNLSPDLASFLIVGDIDQEAAIAEVEKLTEDWSVKNVIFEDLAEVTPPAESQVYFYDVPGAKQSVLHIGYPALAQTDEDFFPATVMNYRLGGGSFASQLTQELREGKGYTYGIRSGFDGSTITGPFLISSGVRSNITFEAVDLIKEILEDYPENFNDQDLEVTKGFMIKSNARKFETLGSKLQMLREISNFNKPKDYALQQEETVRNITVPQIKALAQKYVNPNKMYYLIVGDAATQLERLEELGFGKPVLLNEEME
ncbi:M16 family metallopeptidase [Salinimicrobium sp. TH3]|uniref:M16 family metallopeptidase n=1 Tax=Salinimicrobium sp. TH3 TaxID=2997342 RepID=UPI0022725BA5|nr:pitrilysin family protein [Salinimicrobium sp. TH3]MCY2687414.1 pitrilysin family protein [Salinimicrobium sp. TH3]